MRWWSMASFTRFEALDPSHPLTPGKLANLAQLDAAYQRHDIALSALPAKVVLQTTDACNLNCPMCQIPLADKKRHMPRALFERVVDELFPTLMELHPTNLGEPLVSPWFVDLCGAMRAHGVALDLTTNGTLLDDKRIAAILPVARDIKVSFDGATAATYERIRSPARFDQVCANVATLARALGEIPDRRPDLSLQMTLMRSNVVELPELVRLAARLGATRVKAYHLFAFRRDLDSESLMLGPDIWRPILDEALRVGADLGVDLRLAEPSAQGSTVAVEATACHLPWFESWVDLDGSVLPCHSHGGDAAGNLNSAEFASIWNGPLYQRIRQGFADRLLTWHCDGCGMNCQKAAEHVDVPYDPENFLSPDWRRNNPAARSSVRWSGRMKQFDLDHRRRA